MDNTNEKCLLPRLLTVWRHDKIFQSQPKNALNVAKNCDKKASFMFASCYKQHLLFIIGSSQRDHDHVVRIRDKIRNKGVLATGPSDSFDRCAKKKKNLPSLVFQVHIFGKHEKRKDILFSLSFPLTLLWTGFKTHCLFPKRINSPRERKLKIKTVVPSLCPASTQIFSFIFKNMQPYTSVVAAINNY